jgi:hypothetical protein
MCPAAGLLGVAARRVVMGPSMHCAPVTTGKADPIEER